MMINEELVDGMKDEYDRFEELIPKYDVEVSVSSGIPVPLSNC
jgi:hypothetical protein